MTDTVLQSFCERCGTRYTFTEPQESKPEAGRNKRALFGRRTPARDADAEPSVSTALPSSERFKGTFHFCLECRQYTCANCWNAEAGACIGCRAPGAPAVPSHGVFGATKVTRDDASAWPSGDIAPGASRAAKPGASAQPTQDGAQAAAATPKETPWATSASGSGSDGGSAVELDEWGRPRASKPNAEPEEVPATQREAAVVDPWRGVVFSEDEAPAGSTPTVAEPTEGILDFGAAGQPTQEAASWPTSDRPTESSPKRSREEARDAPPEQEEDDDGDVAASRLQELTSGVDATSWLRATSAAAAAQAASDAAAGRDRPTPEQEPVEQVLDQAEALSEALISDAGDAPLVDAPRSDDDIEPSKLEATHIAPEPEAAAPEPEARAPEPAPAEPEPGSEAAARTSAEPEPSSEAEGAHDEAVEPAETVTEGERPAAASDTSPEPQVEMAPTPPAPAERPGHVVASTPQAPAEGSAAPSHPSTPPDPPATPEPIPSEAPQPPPGQDAPVVPAASASPEPRVAMFSFAEPEPPTPPAEAGSDTASDTAEAAEPAAPDPSPPPTGPGPLSSPAPSIEVWNSPSDRGPFLQPYVPPADPIQTTAAATPPGPPQPPIAPPPQGAAPPPAASPPTQQPVPPSAQFIPPPMPSRPPVQPTGPSRAGTHACPNCGLPLSAKAKFCRRCGSPQAQG